MPLSLKFVLNAVLHSVALAIFLWLRYAEIVNVKLGNGQNRKGQVLEIAGRKAVVQVRYRDYICSTNYYTNGTFPQICASIYWIDH